MKAVKTAQDRIDTRNRYFFGLGTVGRDMLYSLVSMYFITFATEALNLSDKTMWFMSAAFLVLGVLFITPVKVKKAGLSGILAMTAVGLLELYLMFTVGMA